MPKQKNVTTTVSHLHDGMVSQISKILRYVSKICMLKSQRIHPSYHRHKTFCVGIMYHTKFQTSLYNCLLIEVMLPTHYNEVLKSGFCFHCFSFIGATHLRVMLLPENLYKKY